MDGHQGAGQLGIAQRQRLQDGRMLAEDTGGGAGLGDALPGAQPQGAARQRIQQAGQIRVARCPCDE